MTQYQQTMPDDIDQQNKKLGDEFSNYQEISSTPKNNGVMTVSGLKRQMILVAATTEIVGVGLGYVLNDLTMLQNAALMTPSVLMDVTVLPLAVAVCVQSKSNRLKALFATAAASAVLVATGSVFIENTFQENKEPKEITLKKAPPTEGSACTGDCAVPFPV